MRKRPLAAIILPLLSNPCFVTAQPLAVPQIGDNAVVAVDPNLRGSAGLTNAAAPTAVASGLGSLSIQQLGRGHRTGLDVHTNGGGAVRVTQDGQNNTAHIVATPPSGGASQSATIRQTGNSHAAAIGAGSTSLAPGGSTSTITQSGVAQTARVAVRGVSSSATLGTTVMQSGEGQSLNVTAGALIGNLTLDSTQSGYRNNATIELPQGASPLLDGSLRVNQAGGDNSVVASIGGSSPWLDLAQTGDRNSVSIQAAGVTGRYEMTATQAGNDNTIRLSATGGGHRALIRQEGDRNRVALWQGGMEGSLGNRLNIDMLGSDNALGHNCTTSGSSASCASEAVQSGANLAAEFAIGRNVLARNSITGEVIAILRDVDGTPLGNGASNRNWIALRQEGLSHSAAGAILGDGNSMAIEQKGGWGNSAVLGIAGANNAVSVVQDSSGSAPQSATVAIHGSSNRVTVDQPATRPGAVSFRLEGSGYTVGATTNLTGGMNIALGSTPAGAVDPGVPALLPR